MKFRHYKFIVLSLCFVGAFSCKKAEEVNPTSQSANYDVSHLEGNFLLNYSKSVSGGGDSETSTKDIVLTVSSDGDSIYIGNELSFLITSNQQLTFTSDNGTDLITANFSSDFNSLDIDHTINMPPYTTTINYNGDRSTLDATVIPSDYNLSFTGTYEFSIEVVNTEFGINDTFIDTLVVSWGPNLLYMGTTDVGLQDFHSTYSFSASHYFETQNTDIWFRNDSVYYANYFLDTSNDPFWETISTVYAGRKL